jgi:hypothetical protein
MSADPIADFNRYDSEQSESEKEALASDEFGCDCLGCGKRIWKDERVILDGEDYCEECAKKEAPQTLTVITGFFVDSRGKRSSHVFVSIDGERFLEVDRRPGRKDYADVAAMFTQKRLSYRRRWFSLGFFEVRKEQLIDCSETSERGSALLDALYVLATFAMVWLILALSWVAQ